MTSTDKRKRRNVTRILYIVNARKYVSATSCSAWGCSNTSNTDRLLGFPFGEKTKKGMGDTRETEWLQGKDRSSILCVVGLCDDTEMYEH